MTNNSSRKSSTHVREIPANMVAKPTQQMKCFETLQLSFHPSTSDSSRKFLDAIFQLYKQSKFSRAFVMTS